METRLWKCPGCSKTYKVLNDKADPTFCRECRSKKAKAVPPPIPAKPNGSTLPNWFTKSALVVLIPFAFVGLVIGISEKRDKQRTDSENNESFRPTTSVEIETTAKDVEKLTPSVEIETTAKDVEKLTTAKDVEKLTPSVFMCDTAGGKLAVCVDSPVFYVTKSQKATYYRSVMHAFRDSDGKVHRDTEGFYPVNGAAVEIKLSSDTPDILEVGKVTKLGIGNDLTIKKEGNAKIKIEFGNDSFTVPIKVVKLDIAEGYIAKGDNGADVVRKFGLPDEEKNIFVSYPHTESRDNIIYSTDARSGSRSAKHWKYKKYPYLVISIVNGKVYKISSYREEGTGEFVGWMSQE